MAIQTAVSVTQASEAAVREQLGAFRRHFAARDPDAFAELYTEDAVHCAPGMEPFRGRLGVRGFAQALFDAGARDLTLSPERLEGSGELVAEYGRYDWTAPGPTGQLRADHGKYLNVWRCDPPGTYRILFQIWHSDLAAEV